MRNDGTRDIKECRGFCAEQQNGMYAFDTLTINFALDCFAALAMTKYYCV